MKRFTETTKWQDPWYRRLSPSNKCLWQFLCDMCDHAGVIDLDVEAASFSIGQNVYEEDLSAFGDRLQKLSNGKLHIVKFVTFQYGELSENCPAHKPVFQRIREHQPNGYKYPLNRVLNTLQDKDKDKDKDKEGDARGDKPKGRSQDFQTFYSAYPRKKAPDAAEKAWSKLNPPLAQCLAAIESQKKSDDWTKDGGQFIPYPATWLNRGSWKEESPLKSVARTIQSIDRSAINTADFSLWATHGYPSESWDVATAPEHVIAKFLKTGKHDLASIHSAEH